MHNITEPRVVVYLNEVTFISGDDRLCRPLCDLCEDSRIRFIIDDHEQVDFTWGEYYMIGTPAYWISQAQFLPQSLYLKAGESLTEEVVFCLLGGHGISFELNSAAYQAMKKKGLVSSRAVPSEIQIEKVLREPLIINGRAKPVHYRFPVQKSKRIHDALRILQSDEPPTHPLSLRQWLMKIPGIGFKTASWIVRNHLNSDIVAIIDIHIQRAGVAAGFFKPSWKLPRDYDLFEKAFLCYSNIGGIPASVLDVCIWEQMRSFGRHASSLLPEHSSHKTIINSPDCHIPSS